MTLRPLAAGPREPQQRIRPPLLPLWAALPAAAVAGILMDVAYPDVGWWPAAFVATGVLLIAAVGRSVMGSLAVGLVFGIVFFSLVVSWTSRYLGPLPWAVLTIVEGVLTAVWLIPLTLAYRWLSQLIRSDGARLILLPVVVASLWTGREVMLGAWPYGGFPWARLGMTQSEAPAASLASWVGVSGLSFAMVFAVAVFIEWVRTRAWRFPARYVAPLLTVGVLVLTPAFSTTPAGTMRLGAVQGNGRRAISMSARPGRSHPLRAELPLRSAEPISTSLCGQRDWTRTPSKTAISPQT